MRRASLLVIVFLLTSPGPAAANVEDEATAISKQVMSPFCEGVTLHDCASQAALDLRAQIERWVADGWSRDRIMNELVARYGEDVRATPPVGGNGLLAWALPIAAVLVGGVVVWRLAAKWSSRPRLSTSASEISDDDRRRLDAELATFRSEA